MSDIAEVAANVERDLIARKARMHRQPAMHPTLPEFTSPHAPAQSPRQLKESPRIRAIVEAGTLAALEERNWPAVRLADVGGAQVHNSRWASTTVSGEDEWRRFLAVVDLAEIRRLGRLLAAAPEMFASPPKPPRRTAHRTTSDLDDERFTDAMKGAV